MNIKFFQLSIFFFTALTTLSCKDSLDCSKFKNGHFYSYSPTTGDKIIIERNDSTQFETNTKTGQISKNKVVWISPCEYRLININDKPFKNGTDSFLSVTSFNVTIEKAEKDYYVYTTKLDSADKHVEFSDTIFLRK